MEKIVFEDGQELITKEYTDLFYSNLCLRPSCATCKYSTYKRIADFTVGDYWGVENYDPEFFDNAGISLIILNTHRAMKIKNYLDLHCDLIDSDVQKCQQPNMIAPSPIPTYRSGFWTELKGKGFEPALKRYTALGKIWFKVRRKVYKYTGQWY